MDLYLLKVKHIYDEEFEECGIFSSKTKMEEGKKKPDTKINLGRSTIFLVL